MSKACSTPRDAESASRVECWDVRRSLGPGGPRSPSGALLHRRRQAPELRPCGRRVIRRAAVAEPADPAPRGPVGRPPARSHASGQSPHRGRPGLPAPGAGPVGIRPSGRRRRPRCRAGRQDRHRIRRGLRRHPRRA